MADGIKIRELALTNGVEDRDVLVVDKINTITNENITYHITFENFKKGLVNDTGLKLEDLSDVNVSNPQADHVLVYDGNEWVNKTGGAGGSFAGDCLVFKTSSTPLVFKVTVGTRTAANRFYGDTSSTKAFYIDGEEAPSMAVAPGRPIRFDTSDSTLTGMTFHVYTQPTHVSAFGSASQYTKNVTYNGTPGTPGAYLEILFTQKYETQFGTITLTEETPRALFYNCDENDGEDFMGNSIVSIGRIQDVQFGVSPMMTPEQMAQKISDLETQVAELNAHVANLFTIE